MSGTILFIDDEPLHIKALQHAFAKAGFAVAHCLDVEAGLRHLETRGADAVFLDIVMPGEDGITACQRVARAAAVRGGMVLIHSGLDYDESTSVSLYEAGAVDLLAKPAPVRSTMAKVAALLRYREGGGHAPAG